MNFKKYIHKIRVRMRNTRDASEREALNIKMRYALAYRQGADALDRFRGSLIAKEIGKKHDINAQIAILANKDTNYVEYMDFQGYRTACKAIVDEKLSQLKAEIEVALK